MTRSGPVRGVADSAHRSFQGIPYAAAPVGALRWASPAPPESWETVREATSPGSDCPQVANASVAAASLNEDCLYLNVTTPANSTGRRLPVMVWFHGGAFTSGSASAYDAQRLVDTGNVIVVTVNYRLGVFGYLAHPALDTANAANGLASSGAFGIEDQQAALRWVRDNAAVFGGNPSNVTIFGESAGGMSNCDHLAAPASAGLFQRAILESGPCTFYMPPATTLTIAQDKAEVTGQLLSQRLGCSDPASADPAGATLTSVAACMRGVSVADLLAATGDGTWIFWPTHGGTVIPVEPAVAIASGHFNRVPVIQGTNRDEHRMFVALLNYVNGHSLTAEEYTGTVQLIYGQSAAQILARYPLTAYDSPSLAMSALFTDGVWSCAALQTDQLLAARVPTWSFEFADQRAPWYDQYPKPDFPTGAYHGSELSYLFGGAAFPDRFDSAQRQLSAQMIGYWTSFAWTGNPNQVKRNSPARSDWPQFSVAGQQTLAFTPDVVPAPIINLGTEHNCGFWRSL